MPSHASPSPLSSGHWSTLHSWGLSWSSWCPPKGSIRPVTPSPAFSLRLLIGPSRSPSTHCQWDAVPRGLLPVAHQKHSSTETTASRIMVHPVCTMSRCLCHANMESCVRTKRYEPGAGGGTGGLQTWRNECLLVCLHCWPSTSISIMDTQVTEAFRQDVASMLTAAETTRSPALPFGTTKLHSLHNRADTSSRSTLSMPTISTRPRVTGATSPIDGLIRERAMSGDGNDIVGTGVPCTLLTGNSYCRSASLLQTLIESQKHVLRLLVYLGTAKPWRQPECETES